jgi:hypothetical protein
LEVLRAAAQQENGSQKGHQGEKYEDADTDLGTFLFDHHCLLWKDPGLRPA